jgi:hypothetical protein
MRFSDEGFPSGAPRPASTLLRDLTAEQATARSPSRISRLRTALLFERTGVWDILAFRGLLEPQKSRRAARSLADLTAHALASIYVSASVNLAKGETSANAHAGGWPDALRRELTPRLDLDPTVRL